MTNHAVSNRADLRERTKTMSRHGDRRGQIADFRHSFETINWLYLLFKCGIKTKTHFEWLLWHWSSLGQLNLEPTRPNGLVGCKVPTDLVKISVKEATHMGFHYITALQPTRELQTAAFSYKLQLHSHPWIKVLTCPAKWGMDLLTHSQTSTEISQTLYKWCNYLSMLGYMSVKGAPGESDETGKGRYSDVRF